MRSQSSANLNLILVLLIFVTLGCVCPNSNGRKVQTNTVNGTVNTNEGTLPAPSPSVLSSPTPFTSGSPTDPKSSPEYQSGYKIGYKEGRSWAKEVVGGGMPKAQGIRMMARYQASKSGSKDHSVWEDGWFDGFGDGYQRIKPPKINSSNLQALSWANAKPGVKLYDHEGNYQVTIMGVNETEGTIRVKYPPSSGNVIEDKNLISLSSSWFVKK